MEESRPLFVAAAWAAILAVIVAVYFGCQAHQDAQPSQSPPPSGPTDDASGPPGPPTTSQPSAPRTTQPRPALWQGAIRITDNGVNLGGRAPGVGDAAFATIIYKPESNTFSTNHSRPAALWDSTGSPTYEQCVAQLGAQALSPRESKAIPYQDNLGICVKTFSGNNIAFIRITQPPSGQSAQASAMMWVIG